MNRPAATILGLIAAGMLSLATARAEDLLIIANPSVSVATLSLREISSIYLLKTTDWPDGTRIVPVNREATSETRARFTGSVLKQDNADLSTYWNEMHFKGKMPPLVQESDQAVLAFIQKVPGAIGYISAAAVPPHIKVLAKAP